MTPRGQEWAGGVKALSVLLGVLVWLAVMLERPGEVRLNVPVVAERVPAGLRLESPPQDLQVVVSGPRVRLLLLTLSPVNCRIDLTGGGAGEVSVAPTQGSFNLDHEVKVVRVFPEWINLKLVRSQ